MGSPPKGTVSENWLPLKSLEEQANQPWKGNTTLTWIKQFSYTEGRGIFLSCSWSWLSSSSTLTPRLRATSSLFRVPAPSTCWSPISRRRTMALSSARSPGSSLEYTIYTRRMKLRSFHLQVNTEPNINQVKEVSWMDLLESGWSGYCLSFVNAIKANRRLYIGERGNGVSYRCLNILTWQTFFYIFTFVLNIPIQYNQT